MNRVLSAILIIFAAALVGPKELVAARGETIEKTFSVKMGGRLELDLDAGGRLEIVGWSREEIAVTAEIGGDDAEDVRVDFDTRARGLKIRTYCKRRWGCDSDVKLTIRVPERIDVSIDSKGGGVSIEGVEGKLEGKTMGGGIELVRVKGEVELETMGGSIVVEDSEADGKVCTMGGSVRIENVKGNLKGSTMGGKVIYRNVTGRAGKRADKEMNVRSLGGDIVIEGTDQKVRAKTYGGDIDVAGREEVNVKTMGGDINVDEAPLGAKVSTMGGDVRVGSAGKYVEASTMGGDIEIEAIDGRVKASTMGGDVTVTMVGDPKQGCRDVELSSMGGDIVLTVPAGLSMEFDLDIQVSKGKERRYRIESDFPVKVELSEKWEGGWRGTHKHIYGTGKIGGGEHRIKIKTHNGDIFIKKGP